MMRSSVFWWGGEVSRVQRAGYRGHVAVLSVPDAYARLETGPVVVARPEQGLVVLTGPQRVWFLQNTVTADLDAIESGTWTHSCFLTPKGKVVAHFRAGKLAERVVLDVDPPGTQDLIGWFTRYRFRTQVEVTDASSGCFTVIGPRTGESSQLPSRQVEEMEGEVRFIGDLGPHRLTDIHSQQPPPETDELPFASRQLYEVLRVEAGVGKFGTDYGPETLPQEAGLIFAVSVQKGCYVGQEVMARLHFRGHVNRVLRKLAFDGEVPVGAALLHDGRPVGRVSSSVVSPGRGPIGLGMVRVDVPAGEGLQVESGGSAVVGAVPAGTKVAAGPPTQEGA